MSRSRPTAARRDTGAVLDALARELAPARRLWPPLQRLAVWTAFAAVFAAWTLAGGVRADLAARSADPAFVVELGLLMVAATAMARAALGAAVPGDRTVAVAIGGGLALLAAAAGVAGHPADVDLDLRAFAAAGVPCALHTATLALPPALLLFVGIRRGWPLHSVRAGLLAGAAGSAAGFALMRLLCPLDDALHLVLWHWGAVALTTTVAAAAGAAVFAKQR